MAKNKVGLRTYLQHLVMVAKRFLKDRQLDSYAAVSWFLDGLPEDTRKAVMEEAGID